MRLVVRGHCGGAARTSPDTPPNGGLRHAETRTRASTGAYIAVRARHPAMQWARLGSCASLLLTSMLLAPACASSTQNVKEADATKKASAQKWGRTHQFDDAGMDVLEADIDGDGRADVKKVSRGGVLQREEWDLNGDGKVEVWRYFDAAGNLVEEEWDADFDGHSDVIAYYEGGQLTRREESNNFTGKMTTRKHYRDGIVTLVEQDTEGQGRFDTWEFYEAGKLVKVGRDTNGDGKEDTFSKPTAAMAALAPEPPRAPTQPTAPEPKAPEPKPTAPESPAPQPTDTPAPATNSGGETSTGGGSAETAKTP